MAAAAAVSLPHLTVEEYLRNTYEPDADYVDGILEERSVGEWDHGDLQGAIDSIFRQNAKAWNIRVATEVRVQTSATRYRIPDVCVVSASLPREQIVRTPPVLCIEVLSPEDRFSRVEVKCQDYLRMGVPEVWIVDPQTRTLHILRGQSSTKHQEGIVRLSGTPAELDIAQLFAVLDLS